MNLEELEEALSRPTAGVVDTLSKLGGDVVVLGAGGKMGPSLARMARRTLDESKSRRDAIAVARFSRFSGIREQLESHGVRTIACDLLDRESVAKLPDAGAVLFLAGTKFGTKGSEALTWAMNAYLPGLIAERYAGVPTVVFSSGNVYPFVTVESGGATEETPPNPIGEYAQSVLARERVFEHFCRRDGTPVVIYRLNYAAELRYGVPVDIAQRVWNDTEVDVTTGYFNVIWQGDANAIALRCLEHVASPPRIINVTGPEIVSVREIAQRFGRLLDRKPRLCGTEQPTALLNDASLSRKLFGAPSVSLDRLTTWIGEWVRGGGPTLNAPTHFEVRDGTF